MKRKWSLRLGAAVLCAVLLGSCGSTAAAPAESTAPADPLTGQQLLYPEQRAAAVVIENTTGSTTQWGIGSASVVLEALTEEDSATSLCLVYPSVGSMPQVGPVTAGQDLYWRILAGQQIIPVQLGGGQQHRAEDKAECRSETMTFHAGSLFPFVLTGLFFTDS